MPDKEQKHGQCYALLASVGDYHKISAACLPTYEMDIKQIRYGLTKGLRFKEENIRVLGENGFVTAKEMAMAAVGFSQMLCENDTFVFYFSGHGKNHALLFSDMGVELQSVLEVTDRMPAGNKLVILDCCYSGDFQTDGPRKFSFEDRIRDFAGHGIAIFASSAADSVSRLGAGRDHSLYTGFLAAAMLSRRIIRKGKISLPDIHEETDCLMQVWNRHHPEQSQQPIFRSCMGGTMCFQVEEYHPYIPADIYHETDRYVICSVKPLSTAGIKRLAAFVIPKESVEINDLPAITKEIAEIIKDAEVYASEKSAARFEKSSAQAIWCYFGRDRSDIIHHRYFAYTVWAADEETKRLYYKNNGKHSCLTDDICMVENISYDILRKMQQPEQPREEFITETRKLLSTIVTMAEEFIRAMQEIANRTTTVDEVREEYSGWIADVKG